PDGRSDPARPGRRRSGLAPPLLLRRLPRGARRAPRRSAHGAPDPGRPLVGAVDAAADRQRLGLRLSTAAGLAMEAGEHAAALERPSTQRTGPSSGVLARYSPPTLIFAVAVITSGALLLVWQSHLTFSIDDWDLLLHRRGFNAHVFLDPHVRHILI